MRNEKQRKLFILGAGFSKPAGLPLGKELLHEINNIIKIKKSAIFHEYREVFAGWLEAYRKYSQKKIKNIDIEEFIEFVDYEHFLQFSGGLSSERGGIQNIIRFLIAKCLSDKQKNLQHSDLYKNFVSELSENDIIISLNYDTILESYFNELKMQYHLFPPDLCNPRMNIPSQPSTTLLKIHGSINWFDYKEYSELIETRMAEISDFSLRPDFIFNNQRDKPKKMEPIIPYGFIPNIDTHLTNLCSISMEDLDRFINAYNTPFKRIEKKLPNALTHPVILSPAYSKLLYSQPIKHLFYGANFYGRDLSKIVIIGCGLPEYDRYIRQWIYAIKNQYFGMHIPK